MSNVITTEAQVASTVMLIEDNPLTVKLVTLTLTGEGFKVVSCNNGADALSTLKQIQPDLILLDMRLPDTNGLDLVKKLRAIQNGANIPIVAFSGFVSMIEEGKIANSGFTDFLLKPVEPSALVKCIKNHLVVKSTVETNKSDEQPTVLIIDDDPLQLKFTALQFVHAGFKTITGCNGLEGLSLAEKHRPNIIVSDVLMPKMDGFQFCKAIRVNILLQHIPIVLVSANYIEEIDNNLASKIGANSYVYRSLGIQKVIDTAIACLKEKRSPLPTIQPEYAVSLEVDIHSRMLQQLERQVSLNIAGRHRNYVQHTILGQIGDFASSLLMKTSNGLNLDDILAGCLDSAGLSHGLFYFINQDDSLVLKAQFGFSTDLDFIQRGLNCKQFLIDLMNNDQTIALPSPEVDEASMTDILSLCNAQSALLVPVKSEDQLPGLLIMFANELTLVEDDWIAFSRNVAAQFTQATELSSTFSKLIHSEQRFRELAKNIKEAFFLLDIEQKSILYLSPAAERIFEQPHERLMAGVETWLDFIDSQHHGEYKELMATLFNRGEITCQIPIVCESGVCKWLQLTGHPIHNGDGKLVRVAGTLDDITVKRQADIQIRYLNRLFAFLSGINSVIIRVENKRELLREACHVAVENGEFDLVWIGLIDAENNTLRQVEMQGSSQHKTYFAQQATSYDIGKLPPDSIVVKAITSRLPQWQTEFKHKQNATAIFCETNNLFNFKSAICLPIISNDKIVGTAHLYAKQLLVFDQDEVDLLTQIASDISFALDKLKTKEQLNYLAFHDTLTGLGNRITLRQQLEDAIAKNSNQTCCLMLININHFRDINDTLGHKIGDQLLIDVAQRLLSTIRDTDRVACLGGDEFAVFIPLLSFDRDISIVANKLNSALQSGFQVANLPLHVEARIGIAMYPIHGDDAEKLWMSADVALSTAKRNNEYVQIYNAKHNDFDPKNLTMLGEFRSVFEQDELVLHWQPKIDLKTMKCTGMEALVRWQHPIRGLLFPDEFIPHLEHTALIQPLTNWVAKTAIAQAKKWSKQGFDFNVAINISVRNLQEEDIDQQILTIAKDADFPVENIVLEVTESAMMKNSTNAKLVLEKLREAGVKVAIDDFGTGHSSLAYLKDLPVTDIKIDKSFVMELDSKGNEAIVKSTIELATNLKLSATAEGIENTDSLRKLQRFGCSIGQGYYFSRPLPADDFELWVTKFNSVLLNDVAN